MRRHIWLTLLALAVLGGLAGWRANGAAEAAPRQTAPAVQQNPDVLAALLVEVRGLRTAMEQMASAGPRVQLAMGRLQLQEQRVNTLMRQIETVRGNLVGSQRRDEGMRQEIAALEAAAADKVSDNPEQRTAMAQQLAAMKMEQPMVTADILRLQGEESTLSQQLALEQGRWSDISRSLDELERALARR